MAWASTWPDGAQSVKTNQATGAANTTYIKTTMNVDHYWDISGDNDGHHQWVEMTQSGTIGTPDPKVPSTGMDGIFYLKAKADAEVSATQDVQPFYTNNKKADTPGVTQEMQMLAMRACGVFTVGLTPGFTITDNYIHNVVLTRGSLGTYTATFTTSFPSENYLFYGGAIVAAGQPTATVNVKPGTLANNKTVDKVIFEVKRLDTGNLRDPLQVWFHCFGG